MIKAIIDIGSNTINLLIAKVNSEGVDIKLDEKIQAELVKGSHKDNSLQRDVMDRALKTLQYFSTLAYDYHIHSSEISAFATASLRGKENALEFVDEVKHKTGIVIKVITGDQEAEYIYRGVSNGFSICNQNVLIMDIGGGSVEFILADEHQLILKKSYNIGVIKLMEMIACHDPLTDGDKSQIEAHISHELSDLLAICQRYKVRTLVGASGAFDTFRDLLRPSDVSPTTETSFNLSSQRALYLLDTLEKSTLAERKQMDRMDMDRVVYIPIAIVLVKCVLNSLAIPELWQCNYSLKEGALFI